MYGNIYIDINFACKLEFISIDLRETVNFKFENENSVETLKEVEENIEIAINLKKIVLKYWKKIKLNIEIANSLHETVNFKFENYWVVWKEMKKKLRVGT